MSYYGTIQVLNRSNAIHPNYKKKVENFLNTVASSNMEMPYMLQEMFNIIDDDYMFKHILSDDTTVALAVLAYQYFNGEAYNIALDCDIHTKLIEYGDLEVYKVDAANGLRYATDGEVKSGIEGLIAEHIYPIGETEFKIINLFYWSITGNIYYYRKTGLKIEYGENREIITSTFELITNAIMLIRQMIDWFNENSGENYTKAIKKLKKTSKNGGFKYATYEKDEITEDVSIKQLVHNIDKSFPRNSSNKDYRKAIALVIKTNKFGDRLSPIEVSFLRTVYKQFIANGEHTKVESNIDTELKAKCERLLTAQYSGLIKSNHFAYTIIKTLRKYGYTRCSAKQLQIINDAIEILDKKNEEALKNNQTTVISDEIIDAELNNIETQSENNEDNISIASISNAIAKGIFEEEDD